MDSHKEHMRQFAKSLHGTSSSLMSDDKYEETVYHLKNPHFRVSPAFKHWVKKKGFAIMDLPEWGLHDVLVIPAPGKGMTETKFFRVIPERDIFDLIQHVHQDMFKHTGYKKVLRHVNESILFLNINLNLSHF